MPCPFLIQANMGFQDRAVKRIEGTNTQQIRKTTFAEYIAQHNFEAANRFLTGQGYPASSNSNELAQRIGSFVTQNGDRGLQAMMILHPDREEILSQTSSFNLPSYNQAMGNNYHNCAGCGGTCGGKNFSNATGSNTNQQPFFSTEKSLNALAVVALVGIVFLAAIRNAG